MKTIFFMLLVIPAITGAQDQKLTHADYIELPGYCMEMLALVCDGKTDSAIRLKYKHSNDRAGQVKEKQPDPLNSAALLDTLACGTFIGDLFGSGDTICLKEAFPVTFRKDGMDKPPVADLLFCLGLEYHKKRNYKIAFALYLEAAQLYKGYLTGTLPQNGEKFFYSILFLCRMIRSGQVADHSCDTAALFIEAWETMNRGELKLPDCIKWHIKKYSSFFSNLANDSSCFSKKPS